MNTEHSPTSANLQQSNHQRVQQLQQWLESQIVGQQLLVERLMISLLSDGHLLVEGAPGLAKTKAIKKLSEGLEASFQRIQFTPDLLPSDITGTEIYRPENASFQFQQGPVFNNLVLADEINRAPAKVQSALLEAMAERQVSVGHKTMKLPALFMVMATQNPIEQEGTYPLPEAQLDRFLMHVRVDYPSADSELEILQIVRGESNNQVSVFGNIISQQTLFEVRQQCLNIHMTEQVQEYLIQLILATRSPEKYDAQLAKWIAHGASPRATIALDRCARSRAWLQGRDFVTPDDIQTVLHDCLRHRIILEFEAEAEGESADSIIDKLLTLVPLS